ncbi:MAG: DUF5680 domain-containing protein [Halanaerobiales bacterium]
MTVGEKSKIIKFLIKAKQETYAGKGPEEGPSRPESHDLKYSEANLLYIDTYLGGERFAGEEALWEDGKPFWAMNYYGRVIGKKFKGDFLKEALFNVPEDMPYRGPEKYHNGDYLYSCNVEGDFECFRGYEEIYYKEKKVYKCWFHGGEII